MNIFERSTREKLRFLTTKGTISTEDLWDLSLESLDRAAKSLNKQVKEDGEESFIKTKTAANKTLELQFEIVKHVITVKMAEAEEKKLRAEKNARRAQILELIAKKEVANLEGKSIEELTSELAALD